LWGRAAAVWSNWSLELELAAIRTESPDDLNVNIGQGDKR
jgi:hypothetical protein